MCPTMYEQGKGCTVQLPDQDLVFERRGKLHIGDFSDWIDEKPKVSLMMTKENKHLYTKKEVQKARDARECLKRAGYPSEQEAIHMIRYGKDIKTVLTYMVHLWK
jgi:hypothetical protein